MMQSSRLLRLAAQGLRLRPTLTVVYNAGDKPLKEREEAAEKVYISQQESISIFISHREDPQELAEQNRRLGSKRDLERR